VAVISGAPGIGKSWLVLDLARAVATGGAWFGMQCTAGRVGVLALESPDWALVERMKAITGEEDGSFWERISVLGLAELGVRFDLREATSTERLAAWAQGLALLVIDPLRLVHAGAEDNETFGVVVKHAKHLAAAAGCAVLLVHHPRKPAPGTKDAGLDSVRGGSTLTAHADSVLVLDRPRREGEPIRASFEKLRSHPRREPLWLAPTPAGPFVLAEAPARLTAAQRRDANLEVLASIVETAGRPLGVAEAHELLATAGVATTRRTLERWVRMLVASGELNRVRGKLTAPTRDSVSQTCRKDQQDIDYVGIYGEEVN
jgi:hypothetical protein